MAVTLYRRSNGYYYIRFRRGVERSTGTKNRTQAEGIYRRVKREHLEGRLVRLDGQRITLRDFRSEYITQRRQMKVSPATIRKDDLSLRSLAEVVGDSCLLRSISPRRLQDWIGALRSRGVTATAVNSYLGHIRSALSTAVVWGKLDKVPKVKDLREPKRGVTYLTPDQFRMLCEAEGVTRRRQPWEFMRGTGLRANEAATLDWRNIHLAKRPWVDVIGKGDKFRRVPLLPQAIEALGPQRNLGPVWFFDRGKLRPGTVTAGCLGHWFKATVRKAGLPDHFKLHDLRHTAATYMVASGMDLKSVQEILGHADIATTMRYVHALDIDHLWNQMTKLNFAGNPQAVK